jgi:amino acid transporter
MTDPKPPAAARGLPRVLGLFDVTVLAGAAMGPAYSLASTMGPMIAADGAQAPVALALLSAIMLCIAIAFSRLSRVRPNAGSSYAWIAQAFGPRNGAYAAWLLVLSNYFATMATALPAGIYTLELFAPGIATSPVADALVGTAWILASTVLLAFGLRPTALVTAAFFAIELLVLAASAVASAFLPHASAPASSGPPIPIGAGIGGLISAMVLGIWMSDGWEVSASTSEETAGPRRTAGLGGIAGLLVTTAILLIAMFAYLRVGPVSGFAEHQADSMAYVADRLGGGVWRWTIVATVLVSTAATLWTTMLYLSRSVFAMGRDGVIARAIGELDGRSVPRNALVAVTVGVAAFTLLTGFFPSAAVALTFVINGSSVFLGALFVGSALAAARSFWNEASERWLGVVVPLIGATGLLAIVGFSIAQADMTTRWIELGGLALGVPFALWRGTIVSPAGPAAEV